MKKRIIATTVMASAIALGTSQAASAGTGGGFFFNAAVSVNAIWPNSQQFHVAFDVDQTNSPWVNLVNRSYALTTHCNGCKTAAIAFQIVVSPLGGSLNSDNEARAVEDHCVNCSNLATSYQFILTTPTPQISPASRQALQGIKYRLNALQWSGLTGDALQAAVDELAGEVQNILLSGAAQPAPAPAAAAAAAPAARSAVTSLAATPAPQLAVNRQAQSQ